MTAETLKPFITPTNAVNNFPDKHSGEMHSKRKTKHLIPIVLGFIAAVLVIGIFSLTIRQTLCVQKLESDLHEVQRNLEYLRQRLGINYLEDMTEFQNEYTNLLIEDPSKVDELENGNDNDDDDDDDDDVDDGTDTLSSLHDSKDYDDSKKKDNDDDDYDYYNDKTDEYSDEDDSNAKDWSNYIDLINQESNGNHSKFANNDTKTETDSLDSSASNDDNVFDDFTNYSDSKKKERKSRSIADIRNELQSNDVAQNHSQIKTEKHLKDSGATTESQLPQHHSHKSHARSRQGRRRVLLRKGESPVSAKSADYNAGNVRSIGNSGTPAAHFHLNRIVPHSHQGDMYVGHATASMDNQWQQHFRINEGILTVHQAGLYYVYAQICYNDNHDQNGFIIYHGHNPFLQCLNTVPTNMPLKVHTCHTSGLIQLQENESIHLRDIHQDRNVILRDSNNRSYFGIIKI